MEVRKQETSQFHRRPAMGKPRLKRGKHMSLSQMPDFFQEEGDQALRSQAKWLGKNLGLDVRFLAKLLHEKESKIKNWIAEIDHLPSANAEILIELWSVVSHLLTWYNYDNNRLRNLLEQRVSHDEKSKYSPLRLPWANSSIRTFLETNGVEGIRDVNNWVMLL